MKKLILGFCFSYCTAAFAQVPQQNSRSESGNGHPGMEEVPSIPYGEEIIGSDRHVLVEKDAISGFYNDTNGKKGFVLHDTTRKEAIFDNITFLSNNEGYIVQQGNLYGVVDKKGTIRIPIQYDSIAEDRSRVQKGFVVKQRSKYGKLSVDGKVVVPLAYQKILGGNAYVTLIKNKQNETQLLFNENGKVLPNKIEYSEVYQNLVIVKSGGKFGLLKNQIVAPFEYDSIYVTKKNSYQTMGTSKNNSKIKLPNPLFQDFQDANYLTVKKNNQLGLMNAEGVLLFPPENDAVINAENFGYYSVKKGNLYGMYFCKSKTPKTTAVEFDKIFTDGYGAIMASKNGKAGIFTLEGEQLAPFEYDNDFIAQYTGIGYRVSKNKKRGILNKEGKIILPTIYDDVDTFSLDTRTLLKVKQGELFGVVDLTGAVLLPIAFDWIGEEKQLIKVVTPKPDRKFGLYDKMGKMIAPVEYQWITNSDKPFSKITILKKEANEYYFLNSQNERIVSEAVDSYSYVLDENLLVNPIGDKNLLRVKSKKGLYGLLDESTQKIAVPLEYESISQRFESYNHSYWSVCKGKKWGLINEKNEVIIPFEYDAMSLDMVVVEYNDAYTQEDFLVVVQKGKKMGVVDKKNQVVIPFLYSEIQRVAHLGLFKAKSGNTYRLLHKSGQAVGKATFDEIANFESVDSPWSESQNYEALTFSNGMMRVIDQNGNFKSAPKPMEPHRGYKTFDELKTALVKALNSKDELLLREFVTRIAPSEHLLYYLKENLFDKNGLYVDIYTVREKYFTDLVAFRHEEWNVQDNKGYSGYSKSSLTHVPDYTLEEKSIVTNRRSTDWAFGDTRFMEKLLRNAVKINGFWISTYFMKRHF